MNSSDVLEEIQVHAARHHQTLGEIAEEVFGGMSDQEGTNAILILVGGHLTVQMERSYLHWREHTRH